MVPPRDEKCGLGLIFLAAAGREAEMKNAAGLEEIFSSNKENINFTVTSIMIGKSLKSLESLENRFHIVIDTVVGKSIYRFKDN